MSEKKFQLTLNGQQVVQDDFNLLGEVSGLAGDRVLAELFRMTPYNGTTVTKAILPYGHQTSGYKPLVAPSGSADGKIVVNPFRAFISSRTAVGTDAQKNWRDIRSGLSVLEATTTSATTLSLAANGSVNPRWDLVYAHVDVDSASNAVVRKQKDPTSKVIANENVSVTTIDKVSVVVSTGTAGVSPDWTTVPTLSDGGSTYYIPLAYVYVPPSFGGTTTVAGTAIAEVAPCLKLARTTGGASAEVGDNLRFSKLSSTLQQYWSTNAVRSFAQPHFPDTVTGMETLIVAVNLCTGFESHADGAILDTRDWRDRLTRFTVTASLATNCSGIMGWNYSAGGFPSAKMNTTHTAVTEVNCGNTFSTGAVGTNFAAYMDANTNSQMASSSAVGLAATASGLQLVITGTPNAAFVFFIDFFGPFGNAH